MNASIVFFEQSNPVDEARDRSHAAFNEYRSCRPIYNSALAAEQSEVAIAESGGAPARMELSAFRHAGLDDVHPLAQLFVQNREGAHALDDLLGGTAQPQQ